MKIIISHDVDHLDASDHLFRDLILEKLWVRSFLHLCQGRISLKTFFHRLTILFHNRMNRIEEVMEFDRAHGIPSVFFFGMDNVLGMSYPRKKAAPVIRHVLERGFDVGVHGVDYQNGEKIKAEHDAFRDVSGLQQFGLRNHYVRFEDASFEKMEQAGYQFDSTWFNKQELEIRAPYKVGDMWEFPLHIMDGYICHQGKLEQGLQDTFAAIRKAEALGMPYCTILFHDYQFDDGFDPQLKRWYEETVRFCEENHYGFISYRDAIKELESNQ
jgi:hypothetical protein